MRRYKRKNSYKSGYFDDKRSASKHRLMNEIPSTITSMPGIETQQLIGSDNRIIPVTSTGENSYSTGYHFSQQKLTPSVQTTAPFGNLALRGISGGQKWVHKQIAFDKYNSFYYYETSDSVSGRKLISVSQDTRAYIKPFIDAISLARKTSATYMPIMQMTVPTDGAHTMQVQKYTQTGRWTTNQPTFVSTTEAATSLGISNPADYLVYLYMLTADMNISRIAYDLQMFIDIFFNNYGKLAQTFYTHRDTIRAMAAFVKRNAIQQPIKTLANLLKHDASLKVCSNNFYNMKDYMLSRIQRKTTSSDSEIQTAVVSYAEVIDFNYQFSGGNAQKFTPLKSIFDGVTLSLKPTPSTTAGTYNFEDITWNSRYSSNVSEWRFFRNWALQGIVQFITNDDLDGFQTFIEKVLINVTRLVQTISNKYADLITVLNETGLNAHLNHTDLPLVIEYSDIEAPYVSILEDIASLGVFNFYKDTDAKQFWCLVTEYQYNSDSTGDNPYGFSIKAPVWKTGKYSNLLNSDLFPMNALIRHDERYNRMYPSGITSFNIVVIDYSGYLLTDTFDISSGQSYLNYYLKFINWLNDKSYYMSYTLTSGNNNIRISSRSQNVLLDDIIMVAPDIQKVYEIGMAANPIVKAGKTYIT